MPAPALALITFYGMWPNRTWKPTTSAKVHMRRTVRGLRGIEREVSAERRMPEPPALLAPPCEATLSAVRRVLPVGLRDI